jgi:Domain of unknown function (DUF1707)
MCLLFIADRFASRPHSWARHPAENVEPSPWPTGPSGSYRVSDAEREDVAEQLRRHAADGRLSFDEFDRRLDECLAAASYDQLRPVLRDLPMLVDRDAAAQRPLAARFPLVVLVGALLVIGVGVSLTGRVFPFLPLVPLATWALLIGWRVTTPRRHRWDQGPLNA